MKLKSSNVMAALLAVLGITLSSAQAAELKVGDPAPKLQTGEWIQSDPVKRVRLR